jgi:hypothetical protein
MLRSGEMRQPSLPRWPSPFYTDAAMDSSVKSHSHPVSHVYWYGERGVINALVSHISRREMQADDIKALLHAVCWGNGETPEWVGRIQDFAFIVEVGLADFGDPDLLVVCYTDVGVKLVFVEAKVVSYTESMQSTSPDGTSRWGMAQQGFNSSINGQLTLKYRFAKALSRWDGVSAAIVEDEVVFRAYVRRLNDSLLKAPGRSLVKEKILKQIIRGSGLNGIAENDCYFIALTWDTSAKSFLSPNGVPQDCLPVFLDSRGEDVFATSLQRVGWLGYRGLNSSLQLVESPEYVAAFATMLDSVEPSDAFYRERRSGRSSSFLEWVVSLAFAIANGFDSHVQKKEGSFSLQDENGLTIAKIMPRPGSVFVGVRDGLPLAIPPSGWQSASGHISIQKIGKVNFSGRTVTTLKEASDFVTALKGRINPRSQPSEERLEQEEDGAI